MTDSNLRVYKKIRIKQFNTICILGFLLFFHPARYVIGGTINNLINIITFVVAGALIICSLLLRHFGYRMKKSIQIIWALYFWCLVGSSIINIIIGREIDYADTVVFFSIATAFILLCDIGIWYSPEKTMRCFLLVGITVCTLNAFTVFLYFNHGGMNHSTIEYGRTLTKNYFLLGEDNATYFWSWPVLVVTWFYYYRYSKSKFFRISALAFTIILSASYLYVWSAMAMVACISVPIVLFIFIRGLNREKKGKRIRNHKGIQFWYMWILGLLFNMLLSLQVILPLFQPIIVKVFHKPATLSSRTFIWERSLVQISQSPLFGYGSEPAELTTRKILINHTHNLFLETLYRGGWVALIILVLFFIILTIESSRVRTSILYKYLIIMVFAFLIYSSVYFAFYRYHYLILYILMAHTELFGDSPQGNLGKSQQTIKRSVSLRIRI